MDKNDPWAKHPRIIAAKRKDLHRIISRGTLKLVLHSEIPKNANRLSCRYVVSIKESATDSEVCKARIIMGGHQDVVKNIMIHSSKQLNDRVFA